MITELKPGVYWVGVVDWAIRRFHGYELSVPRGSSYNAYLIVDEKIVLIDTVWHPFLDQLIKNIREIVDPARIDIVVANHAEPDHSGGLPVIMNQAPNATLVVSQRGRESVEGHYHQQWNFKPVKTGDRINIGKSDLLFIEAPMLHWPDSMFTYLTGKNILFPNDAFGQHYAAASRFNDQVDRDALDYEALKYYANIITPFSNMVTRKLAEFAGMNLPVEMIAPSHGIIWRDDPLQIVKKYGEWAAQKPEKSAVILYDTMWNATRHMAEAIGEGMAVSGVPYKIFHMAVSDRNDVVAEVFKSKAVVVGSPTFNQGLLPTIRPILEDLKGLKFENKIGAAFGSYGWSGEAVGQIEEHLALCRMNVIPGAVKAKWQPVEQDLASCKEFGQKIAQAIKED